MRVSGHHVLVRVLTVPDYDKVCAAAESNQPVTIGLACYCEGVESYSSIELDNIRAVRPSDDGYEFTGKYFAAHVHADCGDTVIGLLASEWGSCRVRVCTTTSSVDIDFRVTLLFAVVE